MAHVDVAARGVVHDAAHHPAKAIHRRGAGFTVCRAQTFLLALEQPDLQRRAGRGQAEQPLTPVGAAGQLRDIPLFHQGAQHAGERLLGDAQDAEKVGHGDAGIAADEVQRPVVSAPETQSLEGPFGRFHLEVVAERGVVRVRSTLEVARVRVTSADYPRFRAFLAEVDAAIAQRVLVTSGAGS